MKKIFLFGFFIGIFLVILMYATGETYNLKKSKIDLKTLSISNLDGTTINWTDFKNKQKLITFWGSYCPPCTEKLPQLNQYAKENPDVDVINISSEAANRSINYLDHFNYSSISFVRTDSNFSDIGIYLIPKTILIKNNKAKMLTKEDFLNLNQL